MLKFSRNEVEATRPLPLAPGLWDLICSGRVYTNVGFKSSGRSNRAAMQVSISFSPVQENSGIEIEDIEQQMERGQTWLKYSIGEFSKFNGEGYDEKHVMNSVANFLNKVRKLVPEDRREAFDTFEWEGKQVEGRGDEKDSTFLIIDFAPLGEFLIGSALNNVLVKESKGKDNVYSDIDLKSVRL